MRKINEDKLHRIIDANFNRAKEGFRVCEDICRFILDEKVFTRDFKELRHKLSEVIGSLKLIRIIQSRDIENDVGTASTSSELKRKEVEDIFYANIQRTKESVRVLEEFFKLIDKNLAVRIKNIRYKIYALEKKISAKL